MAPWVLMATALGTVVVVETSSPPSLGTVTIEGTGQPIASALLLAQLRGYFADEGLEVNLTNHPTGRQALKAMLTKGSDYAICADTPFVMAHAKSAPVTILAGIGDISRSIRLIGRRDHGITSHPESLVQRRLGVVRGTNSEYVAFIVCLLYDLPREEVMIVDLTANQMNAAVVDGTVDAVSTFDPYASRLMAQLGNQAIEVNISDFYRAMWVLVARTTHRDPRREQAVLRALMRATADLERDPARWQTRLAAEMGLSGPELARAMPHIRLRITMDQSLLLNLEAQRRWLGLKGPESFNGLSPRSLSLVDPEAATLIHPELVPANASLPHGQENQP